MDFLNNLKLSEMTSVKALKVAGIALLAVILILFTLQIVGSSFKSLSGGLGGTSVPMMTGYGEDGDFAYDSVSTSYAVEEAAYGSGGGAQLSARNVANTVIYPPQSGIPAGGDAEEFEVTQYSATIETRKLERTCASFDTLKAREDVIFENANAYDRGCNYTFKVKHESVEEVLAWLQDFNPKTFSENTYTIKRQIDDFTSETQVLENKRASIDETLVKALSAYDEITTLATRTENADALAKIINSKISIIERLTQERININEQLDRLSRAKADQLDRLEYTYFNVNVYKDTFVDGKQLKDSWKRAVSATINDINTILQEVTFGLIALLFLIAQWALYLLIVLVVVKYGWKVGKYLWYR